MRQESSFTRPSEFCPHPERWHANDEQATEIEVSEMIAGLVRALQPDFCLETGTYDGQTTEAIGQALLKNGQGYLVSCEVNMPAVRAAKRRCQGLPVTIYNVSSHVYTPPQPIDFALFDSDIRRADEFRRYSEWMHERTVVVFHDTAPHHVAIRTGVEELEGEGFIVAVTLPTPRGVTIATVAR